MDHLRWRNHPGVPLGYWRRELIACARDEPLHCCYAKMAGCESPRFVPPKGDVERGRCVYVEERKYEPVYISLVTRLPCALAPGHPDELITKQKGALTPPPPAILYVQEGKQTITRLA